MEIFFLELKTGKTISRGHVAGGLYPFDMNSSVVCADVSLDPFELHCRLGSSRQFTGFNREIDYSITKRIWDRAGEFFPTLRAMSPKLNQIRIGHRPYMPDGKPVIGPVPGMPKVLLATGHEGSGLCMALGTAEMVSDMILGNTEKVDSAPFSIQGRSS